MQYASLEIAGNLTANPTASFAGGITKTDFRVAATPRHQGTDGTWVDGKTAFISMTAFGSLAENIIETVQSGTAVLVKAKARTNEWVEEATGEKRSRLEYIVTGFGIDLARQQATVTKAGGGS